MLRAWRMRHQCRTPGRPWAWLARIVQREAARHAGRRRELSVEDPEALLPAAPAGDDEAVDRLTAQGAVSGLDDLDRRLIALRYRDDQTTARIAKLVGMPEGTVKVRLHRARKRLRAELEDDDPRD